MNDPRAVELLGVNAVLLAATFAGLAVATADELMATRLYLAAQDHEGMQAALTNAFIAFADTRLAQLGPGSS